MVNILSLIYASLSILSVPGSPLCFPFDIHNNLKAHEKVYQDFNDFPIYRIDLFIEF